MMINSNEDINEIPDLFLVWLIPQVLIPFECGTMINKRYICATMIIYFNNI